MSRKWMNSSEESRGRRKGKRKEIETETER